MTYQNGAFLFYRVSSTCQPMMPSAIEALARQHGIRESIVPAYAGDRQTVARALSQISSQVSRSGWMLRPIKQSKSEVVYGIVKEEKNQSSERLNYDHEALVSWSNEGGNGDYIKGGHEIAIKVDEAYRTLRYHVVAADWTESLTTYLVGDCVAQAIRDDGRVYWVAPAHLASVRQLQPFLEAVGISLVLCEVEAASKSVVQAAAQEGLAEQLATLQAEIDQFDGQQKPSTYRLRVEALQALRKRATVYAGTLGIATDHVQASIDQLESIAQRMLSIRETTVIHKDGSSNHSNGGRTAKAASRKEQGHAEVFYAQSPTYTPLNSASTSGQSPMQPMIQTGFSW